jgi:hypothetical protein
VRYTLFDIDLIIDLTLVYGLLTTALASVFEGSLALLEHLFLAHIELESGVTIFVSALVVAVLFAPLRRRIEGFLSRGVHRREDADGTHTALSRRLREEADLDALVDEESIGGSEDAGVAAPRELAVEKGV